MSKKTVAKATRTEDVKMERALRSLDTRGAPKAFKTSSISELSTESDRRRGQVGRCSCDAGGDPPAGGASGLGTGGIECAPGAGDGRGIGSGAAAAGLRVRGGA